MIGKTVSHYRITEKLDADGVGEVYRAEAAKLGSFVALKFLPDELSRMACRAVADCTARTRITVVNREGSRNAD